MNPKILSSLVITVVLFCVFGFSFALASSGIFSWSITNVYQNSQKVFPDTHDLRSIDVVLKSYKDISGMTFVSDCDFQEELKSQSGNKYAYRFTFFDGRSCIGNQEIYGKNGDDIVKITVFVQYQFDMLDLLLDYPTQQIKKVEAQLTSWLQNNVTHQESSDIKIKRRYRENKYIHENINMVLVGRSQKYLVPVDGYTIDHAHEHSKIPNTKRPYRENYTDGIHHGWDVGSKFGEPVIALDDGIIVRVVSQFDWSDFGQIEYGNNLTDDQKINNLDILRGKQVWLKTMKGDVVFYTHLDDVFTQITPGAVVHKGEPIGTIGVTGVPDKNYTDYHLHFAIHKNPYNTSNAGKYTLDDYMRWDWEFQHQTKEYILEHQKDIFE